LLEPAGLLAHILRAGIINLAIWRRKVRSIAAWPDTSSAGTTRDVELYIPAAYVPPPLSPKIAAPTSEQRAGVAALAREVGDLANLMATLAGRPFVRNGLFLAINSARPDNRLQ